MRKVLIITGPGGDAQGWGDMKVTETMCGTLNSGDLTAEIAYATTTEEFLKAISSRSYDIVWSDEKIEAIARLLEAVSPLTAGALRQYRHDPDLFTF